MKPRGIKLYLVFLIQISHKCFKKNYTPESSHEKKAMIDVTSKDPTKAGGRISMYISGHNRRE